MNRYSAVKGNSGPTVRSDCQISLELTSAGGIVIDLDSKVNVLYGNSIEDLAREILDYFSIINAAIRINDCGALPFVIAARIEAAVRQVVESDREFLPEMITENGYSSSRDRIRFARLYLPGNNPSLMINAGLHSADGIILDLEDSVAPDRKDEARILVRNALRQVDFHGAERMVRINQGERGLKDLEYIIPHNVHLIIVPKCDSADSLKLVERKTEEIKSKYGITSEVFFMPVIETALGVENALSIAMASPNVVAMAIGLEDYTADLGVQRTLEGKESFYARSRLVVAAKAAGIQPIDSVFSDINDLESLKTNVAESKALGFEGMGCVHPRQIPVVRQGFAPGAEEVEKAKQICIAFGKAAESGQGVIALGSKMIDAPVAARARSTISRAVMLGLLPENWQNSFLTEH